MTTPPPRLLELARAATPGPWTVHANPLWISAVDPDNDGEIFTVVDFEHRRHNERANAAFIAAASPSTVLALCERMEELERGRCLGLIADTMVACGEGGNFCSKACLQAARIAELEEGLREACELHRQIGQAEVRLEHASNHLAHLQSDARGGAAVIGTHDAEDVVRVWADKLAALRALAEGKP